MNGVRCAALVVSGMTAGCGDAGSSVIADASSADAARLEDGREGDAPSDAMLAPDAVDPTCGAERLPTAGEPLGGSYALAIGDDGTVYYSVNTSNGPIGRRPPGGPADDAWLILAPGESAEVVSLALGGDVLYASRTTSPAGGTFSIWRIDLLSGEAELLLDDAGTVYGLAVGPDGSLLFTDWDTSAVYRIAEPGTPLAVSSDPLSGPTALLFRSAYELLVLERFDLGAVIQLTLDPVTLAEVARSPAGTSIGAGGWSLGRDELGRHYVVINAVNPALHRYDTSFMNRETLSDEDSIWGALAFGKGSLWCKDLYVSDTSVGLARVEVDVRGVP